MFILMIANARIPLSYHGANIVALNLETFLKVIPWTHSIKFDLIWLFIFFAVIENRNQLLFDVQNNNNLMNEHIL